MEYGAECVKNVSLSAIRATLDKARQLEEQGFSIIHLEMGEPDFATPVHIVEAAKKALDEGQTHYAPNRGLLTLRQAVSDKLRLENNVYYDAETEVVVTTGAAEALFMAFLGLLNPNDEVLIIEPAFPSYLQLARIVGAIPVSVNADEKENWQASLAQIKQAITPRTRMIVINSPNNPTGAVYEQAFLQDIAALAIEYDLLVISDEVYEKIIYAEEKHYSIASFPGMKERTITINGYSKTYAMTGWRLAYVAADQRLIASMLKVHQYTTTCVTSFAQSGAVVATKGSQQCVADMTAEFERRRDLIFSGINQIPGLSCQKPQGAFYAFVNIRQTGLTTQEFVDKMQREAGVSVVPGTAFGPSGEGYIRMSYASSYAVLEEALKRLHTAAIKLRKV